MYVILVGCWYLTPKSESQCFALIFPTKVTLICLITLYIILYIIRRCRSFSIHIQRISNIFPHKVKNNSKIAINEITVIISALCFFFFFRTMLCHASGLTIPLITKKMNLLAEMATNHNYYITTDRELTGRYCKP